jgi:hypothetical protein
MTMDRLIVSVMSLAMLLGGVAARVEGDTKAEQLLAEARKALGDMTIIIEQGLNGDTLLRNQRTLNAPPGAVIRMAPPPANAEAEAQAVRNARADMTRFVLGLLLTAPASMPLEYAYAGRAESDEGKADVIEAKGPRGYRGVAPQMRIQTQQVQGPPDPARIRQAEEAARGAAAAQAAPQVVDITLYFDDYKAVDGVQLPHHISRSVDGKPAEEMTFKTIKVNPSFKAGTFDAR